MNEMSKSIECVCARAFTMSLWLVEALVISVFGIIELAVLGNKQNGFGPETFAEAFIPIFVAFGFFYIYVIAVAVSALAGCCNSPMRRLRAEEQDNADFVDLGPTSRSVTTTTTTSGDSQTSSGWNTRRRAMALYGQNGGTNINEFSNASDNGALSPSGALVVPVNSVWREAVLVDCAIDFVMASILLAMFIVLALVLDRPFVEQNYTAVFVLFYIFMGAYLVLLIIGSVQVVILDSSPAGKASGSATLCAGVLCCCASGYADELYAEADASIDENNGTSLARQQRYNERAEFQERPCVYACAPYAIGSYFDWMLALFLWLLPLALVVTAILLQIYLGQRIDDARCNDERTNDITTGSSTTMSPNSLGLEAPVRSFAGRLHHVATFAPRIATTPPIDMSKLAFDIAAIGNRGTSSAEHVRLDMAIILLPLFIAIGLLILQSFCLCVQCVVRRRSAVEWLIGAIYVLWLAFWLWFLIELSERVDWGARNPEDDEDFQEFFVPLYILFGLTLIIGASGYICLPRSYKPNRAFVSKWGVIVYRN